MENYYRNLIRGLLLGVLEDWKNLDGKVYNGMAGIITIKENKAKFEIITE